MEGVVSVSCSILEVAVAMQFGNLDTGASKIGQGPLLRAYFTSRPAEMTAYCMQS